MRKIYSNKNSIIYILLVITFTIVGIEFGSMTYDIEGSQVFIKGILSGTLLFLIYLVFISPNSPFTVFRAGEKIKYPRDLKYVALYFFLAFVGHWALRHVTEVILYVKNELIR